MENGWVDDDRTQDNNEQQQQKMVQYLFTFRRAAGAHTAHKQSMNGRTGARTPSRRIWPLTSVLICGDR